MLKPLLDFASLEASSLHQQPFEYLLVSSVIPAEYRTGLQSDFPLIKKPGIFPLGILQYGPTFQQLVDALMGAELERIISEKFDLDLSQYERMITCRGQCRKTDWKIHTDSKEKVISALLYLNDDWQEPGGCLRLLNSDRLEDYATEIPPDFGTVLLFRRCDYSFHGHLPYEGKRLALQLNWVKSGRYKRKEALRHRLSALLKSLPLGLPSLGRPAPQA